MFVPAIDDSALAVFESLFNDESLEARTQSFRPLMVLHEAGAPARNLYFVHEGQVRLYQVGPRGADRLVEIYGPGQWCGTEALAGSATHVCRAVVVSEAKITIVSTDKLMEGLHRHPHAAAVLVRQLARKVQIARDDAGRLVFDDCNERLLKTLIRFSDTAAATACTDGVELHITHQQLAQAVGVARETISLALTQFRQRQMVRTGRNRLIFDPRNLQRYLSKNDPATQIREMTI
ncbi:MAG: Crp/Fnr family transcriptional regulator [Phycisphaerales bacterium]|nr:Crp/Fnr family transcriptional regulator [Phycisphaerales bacterium]